MRQIGIIGGGASGMMAAIAAANTSIKDTEITILERRDRIGRKILATGNGKCNLGNTDFSPKRDYRSHDPYRLPEFFARFQTSDTIRFFEERGLYLTEKNGYLYPYSGQASTVLDFFREELERKRFASSVTVGFRSSACKRAAGRCSPIRDSIISTG